MLDSVAGSRRAPWRRLLLLGGSGLVVATVAAYGEKSAQAMVAVLAAGYVVAAVTLARRAGAAAEPVGRRGLPWLVLLGLASAWEVQLLFLDEWMAPLSELMDPVLAHPPLRGAAAALWCAAGYWLLTRPAPDGGRG